MIISVPIDAEMVSTDVTDSTVLYDKAIQAYYQINQFMQDAESIYKYIGVSFIPTTYNSANEQSYTLNQVLFKDATTVKVSSVGAATVLKNPEEYTAVADTTFTFNTWTKPFSKIQTAIPAGTYNGFTKVVAGVTHQLYRDATSSTGWRYKISGSMNVQVWDTERSDSSATGQTVSNLFSWVYTSGGYNNVISLWYDNVILIDHIPALQPTPYSTTFNAGGNTYRVGAAFHDFDGGDVIYFGIQKLVSSTAPFEYLIEANVYTSLDSNSVILNAYCQDTADCANRWLGRTFVLRGTDLYVRTNSGTVETKVVSVPQYTVINNLGEFPLFSLIGGNNSKMPLDGKNYTVATKSTTMYYKVKGLSKFDTIALGHTKADSIEVIFKNSLGVAQPTLLRPIDSKRDKLLNLEKWHTTVIYYSNIALEANSTVEFTLAGTNIELGTILLGISVDAGMTNLELSNAFIDYSVIKEDVYGNIDYVERAKVAVYKGSVDMPIIDYDMTDRLLTSIGGKIIILNGSDSKNVAPDSLNVFASTQKIGRLFDLEQQNKIKDNDMEQNATYTFTLKEIV